MALRDTWHKTLVYFGLAEEDDYPTEERPLPEPEEEIQDRYRETPNVRRLDRRSRRRDDFDDIFADESPPPRRLRRHLRR
jgi:cell division inhibitor SepF